MARERELKDTDFEIESLFHVDPLFSKNVTFFVGGKESAKSLTSIFLSVCTAGGRDFLGFATRQGPVVYLNNEHLQEDHELWIEKHCKGLGLNPTEIPLHTYHYEYTDLTNPLTSKSLLSICSVLNPILLVIDNLGSSLGGQDENHTHVAQKFFHNLEPFLKRDIAIVCTHHFKKSENIYRGSSVFEKQADKFYIFYPIPDGYRLRPTRDESGDVREMHPGELMMEKVLQDFVMSNRRSRRGKIPPILIRVEENDGTGATRLVNRGSYEEISDYQDIKDRIMWLFSLNPGQGFTERGFQEGIGIGDIQGVRRAVEELCTDKAVEYRPQGKNLRVFEVGVPEASLLIPTSTEDEIREAVSGLCEVYRAEGRPHLLVKDHFVEPLLDKVNALAQLVTTGDERLIGPCRRVSKVLRGLGAELVRVREGTRVIL